MTPLYAEINRWRTFAHVWGQADCILCPADWIARVRGVDPASDLRGTYGSLAECQRVTRFLTHPLDVVAPRMVQCGLAATRVAVPGDVGVLLHVADGRIIPHGGLCLGESWAVKSEAGVTVYRPRKVLMAWSVGYVHP